MKRMTITIEPTSNGFIVVCNPDADRGNNEKFIAKDAAEVKDVTGQWLEKALTATPAPGVSVAA